MIVFDIETASRPLTELQSICDPFDPSTVTVPTGDYPAFDPAAVKLGNIKDQAKIDAKIAEARAAHDVARCAHDQAKASAGAMLEQAEAAYWAAIQDRAALSPVTGQVLAIGYLATETGKSAIQGVGCLDKKTGKPLEEKDLLLEFWGKFLSCRSANRQMVGFNSNGFDLPFIVCRSWLLGVDVPGTAQSPDGRYFDRIFVDLLVRWKCGQYGSNGSIKLAVLARFFGVGDKPDGVTGKDFARLWAEERERAIEYLRGDLQMTAACAKRMGYC